ncbi:hypothetical protein KC968_00485 [Candidatus Saccharibacteria bacterium]|nr:hypothetical protein [Candidatus Saccharibacteria bacterium]
MGKKDKLSHYLHTPKFLKFNQPNPTANNQLRNSTQQPPIGTNARNQFRRQKNSHF